MNLTAKLRAWRAKRANTRSGNVTSGRVNQGERDRSFRLRRKGGK